MLPGWSVPPQRCPWLRSAFKPQLRTNGETIQTPTRAPDEASLEKYYTKTLQNATQPPKPSEHEAAVGVRSEARVTATQPKPERPEATWEQPFWLTGANETLAAEGAGLAINGSKHQRSQRRNQRKRTLDGCTGSQRQRRINTATVKSPQH